MTEPTGLATADLVDDHASRVASCVTQFRDIGGRKRFHGPVTTISCRNDNALLKATLSSPSEGGVLVIDGGGNLNTALVGDIIAGLGLENGWAGVIVNGAIRDSRAIGEMPFGCKALGTNPAKSSKTGAGEKDIAVTFGDVTFQPGGWVYADEDGVLFSASGAL